MSATTVDLTTRPMQRDDLPAVLHLLTAALAGGPTGERTPEFFDWKHRLGRFGASPGLVALSDGAVVGVRLFLLWDLVAGGRRVRAVRAVDTATDPAFRGRGIFKRLTLDLLTQLEDEGRVDLVFNTPNANSRPGYLKMGWSPVGTVPVQLSPVRPVRFVRGVRSAGGSTAGAQTGPAGAPSDPSVCTFEAAADVLDDDEADALVAEWSADRADDPRLSTAADIDYLRWRYAAPGLDYRAVPTYADGHLRGIAFGRLRGRGALREFTLGDLVVRRGDATTAQRLLRAVRRGGADYVAAHLAARTEGRRSALRAGYMTVPRQGIGLVANPRRELPVPALDAGSWRLSLGDLEVF